MYVYIAGPITKGNYLENLRRATSAADRIASRGHVVYVPHFLDILNLLYPHEYSFMFNQVSSWIRKCDVLVRIHGFSEGADREEGLARQMGKIVFGGETIDGLTEFMNSQYWCKTELSEGYTART